MLWFFKLLTYTLRIVLGTVLFVGAGLGILMLNDVSIPLNKSHSKIVNAVSRGIGREVRIEEEMRLTLSFFPALVVNKLQIQNETEWNDTHFVKMQSVRMRIALQPLFRKQFEIIDLSAEHVELNFEQRKQGQNNWSFNASSDNKSAPVSASSTTTPHVIDLVTIHHFSLSDVLITYHDLQLEKKYSSRIETLEVSNLDQKKLQAELKGTVDNISYALSISSDPLRRLFKKENWTMQAIGELGNNPLEIAIQYDTGATIPQGKLHLSTRDVNLGRILDKLQLADDMTFFASHVDVQASLKGRDLDQIMKKSVFEVVLSNGFLNLENHVDERFHRFAFEKASLTSDGIRAIAVDFSGAIEQKPIKLSFQTQPLSDFINGAKKINLHLAATLAKADIELKGKIDLPLSSQTLKLDIRAAGNQLDEWNALLISDLPPLGPYSLDGTLRVTPDGYQISELNGRINHSDLSGSIDILMAAERPVWKMDLVSNQFQLKDFIVDGYSLIPGKDVDSDIKTGEIRSNTGKNLLQQSDQNLSKNLAIDSWNIDVNLSSRKVLSGDDFLGDGKLSIRTRENSFEHQFDLNIPGGNVDGIVEFHVSETGIEGLFKIDAEEFDYGIFLRYLDPETKSDGRISAHVDLKLSGKDYSHSLEKGDGKLDFVVWPKNIAAAVMDIWSVNLFFAVLPLISESDSRVNCLVSILDMEDGKITENFFAIDSTKVWLSGNLDISMPEQTIDLALFPHPKKPRIFGIETPVHLSGNFENQDLKIDKKELVGSIFSFIFSPLHVPMRRIFGKKIPSDASDTCGKLLDRNNLLEMKKKINRYSAPPEPRRYY